MARSRLVTSAQVTLYINGRAYAQVTNFRWESATPKKAIHGLDSSEPYELAPTTSRLTGTVGLLRVLGDGGLEGAGIVPFFEDLAREMYFTLTLVERSTDTQIFRADRCSVVSQSWDAPAKGRVSGTMSFEGISWNNEARI